MDPIANVLEQIELAQALLDLAESPRQGGTVKSMPVADVERLAELVLALDGWRRDGGFDPYERRSSDD